MELSNVRFTIPGGKAGLFYAVGQHQCLWELFATVGSLLSADKFALHWGPAAILLGPGCVSPFAEKIAACRGELTR